MADNSFKNDLMYIQNELLGDIKNVEKKLEVKLKKNNQSFEEYKIVLEKKLDYLENVYNALIQRIQPTKIDEGFDEKKIFYEINSINQKMENNYFILKNDINSLRNEMKDSTYKYEKIISDNLQIPGLIGYKSKFLNISEFLQNLYKKNNDLYKSKAQQESDFIKYKEKLNNAFTFNRNQFEIIESKIINRLELRLNDFSKNNTESINLLEEKINTMREENGKNSEDLFAQCNDLTDRFNKIDDVLKSSIEEYNGRFITYKNSFKKVEEKITKFEEQHKSFEEILNSIKEQLQISINTNKNITNKNISNITNLDLRIKDLEKQYLTIKNEHEDLEIEKFYRNKSPRKEKKEIIKNSNKNESNSISDQREIKNPEINNIKNESSSANYHKKNDNQTFEERKTEFSKTKNILNNIKFSKKHKFSRNTFKSKKERFNNSSSRVISGKIFNRFPFISYIQNDNKENINNTLSRKKTKFLNKEKNESKENIHKNKMEKDIFENLMDKKEKESKKQNITSYHNNIYLDKKIDILGKSMVNNYNKIINQINFLKENFINNEIRKTIKLKDNKGNNNSIIFS